ncbi:hypothetical protein CQW23_09364 [Capsicum baccatum]|uniref:Protein kinase domain-containing protein n=1 Tax=Capsicum baccatum TaxID=33114 RepID=A0A2G2WWK4_CAPBA|nr:hypothetical protein CQW23_09364 [Capsicum baccatum]
MGEPVRSGHFEAKLVCYSHGSGGGPRVRMCHGPKKLLGHVGEVGEHPSVALVCGQGNLVGQMGEMVRMGHFEAKSVWAILLVKRVKRRESGILGPNRCAIVHSSMDGLEVQGCCGPKIYSGLSVRLESIPVLLVYAGRAIWVDDKIPNIDGLYGRVHLVGQTSETTQNDANEAYGGLIDELLPTVLGLGLGFRAIWLVKREKQCERGILWKNRCAIPQFLGWAQVYLVCRMNEMARMGVLGQNLCAIAHGSEGHLVVKRAKRREQGILGPNRCAIAHGFRGGPKVPYVENRFGHAKVAGNHPNVVRLYGWGHLVVQAGETTQIGHFGAKSLCYSPWFPGWARGCRRLKIDSGVTGRLGSVLVFPFCVREAIRLVKRAKWHEWGILVPNRCAIAYSSGGGPWVRGLRGPKINSGMAKRIRSISVLPVCVDEAIWSVKQVKPHEWGILGPNRCAITLGCSRVPVAKRHEWSILGPNRCAIAHGSGGRPRVQGCRGSKINSGVPGRLAKRHEWSILGPNRCAIAHGSGGRPRVQGCRGSKINSGVPGRLVSVPVFPVCVGGAIWLVKRAKRREQSILRPNRCAIAHDFEGGPRVLGAVDQKLTRACQGVVFATMAFVLLWIRYRKGKSAPQQAESLSTVTRERISYYELLQPMDELSEKNLIGFGSFVSVYKGVLRSGTAIAVKVFKLQVDAAFKSFDTKCDVL